MFLAAVHWLNPKFLLIVTKLLSSQLISTVILYNKTKQQISLKLIPDRLQLRFTSRCKSRLRGNFDFDGTPFC